MVRQMPLQGKAFGATRGKGAETRPNDIATEPQSIVSLKNTAAEAGRDDRPSRSPDTGISLGKESFPIGLRSLAFAAPPPNFSEAGLGDFPIRDRVYNEFDPHLALDSQVSAGSRRRSLAAFVREGFDVE